jgi:SAM-dependent methyltransferase
VTPGFEELIAEAVALPISGWDTSPIRGRWTTGAPPWDYRTIVRARLESAASVLDLGTGGGEFLSSMAPLPARTFATEGYPPNLPVARRRLEPLGVRVLWIGPDLRIALPSQSVDLVLSRHEEFDPEEVYRVLRPGGVFLTQQVGKRNYEEINRLFGKAQAPPTNAVGSARELAAEVASSGLRVVGQREARYEEAFRDVGALVWYLRFAPWQIPGFSTSRYRETLRKIHKEIVRTGRFLVTAHRILVIAERPASSALRRAKALRRNRGGASGDKLPGTPIPRHST